MSGDIRDKFSQWGGSSIVMMLYYLPLTVKKSVDYNSKQSPRDDRDLGLGVVRVEVNQFHDSLRLCHCSYGWSRT